MFNIKRIINLINDIRTRTVKFDRARKTFKNNVCKIIKGNYSSGEYDTVIDNIVGCYDQYSDALEVIPCRFVVDLNSDKDDSNGEQWYAPDTDEIEMDGYDVLLTVIKMNIG